MEMEFSLSPEDHAAFCLHRDGPRWRQGYRVASFVIVLAVTSLVVMLVMFGKGETKDACMLCLMAAVMGTLWLLVPMSQRWGVVRSLRRMRDSGQYAALFGRRRLTIVPHRIAVVDECGGQSELRWSAITTIYASDSHAFFYLNPTDAIILPRAAFSREEDFREFIETARRYHRDAAQG